MTTKHYIVPAVVSFVTLASVGTAFAGGDYYEGVDISAKREPSSPTQKTDRGVTGAIRANAATYGFPHSAEPAPVVAKGGEGEYYKGISRR
ncbi:hypothetical protein PYH37_001897 [Sinorhizobium numidicum]|uniref:DUF680 domain-containing protein n=1 Tax=Sinorhizobium numidicum TaxID=680248 RepID=A0ABY8CRD4_9HYPH|nr:hypothetical protein [Sinorhizobium numidicum]WEX74467.1 hypothetical protein PYH37_001897 [Sinorhizobium numidicum]WEX80457.1 hypothetical protein PYH38_001899 [Sinorhizobium numidicum]